MKVSSRDILDILRRFELADEKNVPRNVESIKITNPTPINTLVSFVFNRHHFYTLFDDSAEDDVDYILGQIKSAKNTIKGELIKNPRDENKTYEMPYKGKGCYLFTVVSDKKRLDNELALRYPDKSRSIWQKFVKSGFVSVNGQVVTATKHEVIETDKISIDIPEKTDFSGSKLPIIYIDDNVIVINKPIGVLSHSKGALNDEFTVADFFKQYTTYNSNTNRPGIIHRLDRDTSGIMIGARNAETATLLQKQFADRKTAKTYLAIVDGFPKLTKANIDLPINRNPSAPSTFVVDSKGKSAITKYDVLDSTNKYSLIKLQPQTGRTHQLRVHMKYISTPIHGDKIYGKKADRLYLHAMSLEITIPSGNRQTFMAPIPDEFKKIFPNIKL